MNEFVTRFGSLDHYEKGHIEIINDNPKYYVFSNLFEVARGARPYEKVAVAKNLEYVIEAVRAEGTSGWMAASHDEFCIVMDGEVTVEFVKLDAPDAVAPPSRDGTVAVAGEPRAAAWERSRCAAATRPCCPRAPPTVSAAPRLR